MEALRHLQYLTETIGPRGSATLQEREAHDYCASVFKELGLNTKRDEFTSTASAYRPFILSSSILLTAFFVYFISGSTTVTAAFIAALIATVSSFLELAFISNPLKWLLPKKKSRNLIATRSNRGEKKHKIVLMSHIDTHRTPWIWKSRRTFKIYRILSTLGMFSYLALTLLLFIAMFFPSEVLRMFSIAPAVFILLILIMTIQAEMSPYTVGANDNASGIALMLDFAERLKRKPLTNSEVQFVITGCEEVGAHGARNFAQRYRTELSDAIFIVIDNIAGAETTPCYFRSEGILRVMHYPKAMLELAQSISNERPELGARPFDQRGAFTDGTPILMAGLNGITIVNHTQNGWIPNWHHPNDVWPNIDVTAFEKTSEFVWELMTRVDQS